MRTWHVAWVCGLLSVGCVDGSGGGGNKQQPQQGTYRPVSGTVTALVFPGVTTPVVGSSNIAIQMQDALTDPNKFYGHSLQGGYVERTGCTTQGCPLDLNDVRLDTSTTDGMWGLTYAFPVGSDSNWITAASKVASGAQVSAAVNGNTTLSGIVAYALSSAGLNKLASLVSLSATGDGTSLQTRGSVIGLVQQANVIISASDPNVEIYYPNSDFSGTNSSATGATGMFLAVGPAISGSPDTAAAIDATLTITGTAGNANTWASATLNLVPGIVAIEAYAAGQ